MELKRLANGKILRDAVTGKIIKGLGCCCGNCLEKCQVHTLDVTVPTLTLCDVDVSGVYALTLVDSTTDGYCRTCTYGADTVEGVYIELIIEYCADTGLILVNSTVHPDGNPGCHYKWIKEFACTEWCEEVALGTVTIPSGDTIPNPGALLIDLEGACCCDSETCNGCCLPVDESCHETCGDEGRPEIYLDVDITGTTCGELSFIHLPYSEATSTSFEGCIAFECGNNPADSGEYAGPSSGNAYAIGATTSDCETCGDAIETACGTYDGCIYWSLYFSVACEVDESGNPTGRYSIRFSYRHDLNCVYDYSVLYDEGEGPYDSYDYDVNIEKCMATTGELDMTFTIVRGPSEAPICANGLCETRTFTFRIYTE